MKIVMTETRAGSRDGIATEAFQAGREYDLSRTAGERDLAQAFVGAGWARPVVADAAEEPQAKGMGPAPANRARRGPPENKGA